MESDVVMRGKMYNIVIQSKMASRSIVWLFAMLLMAAFVQHSGAEFVQCKCQTKFCSNIMLFVQIYLWHVSISEGETQCLKGTQNKCQ